MNKKYEFTGETKAYYGKTLRRIKAVRSFGNVCAGDIGGWIENENNLGQSDNSWVFGDARVYGDAWVFGDAQVSGDARVFGDARVYGDARVFGDAQVSCTAGISSHRDLLTITGLGREGRTTTFFRTRKNEIFVTCGCFSGYISEFRKRVAEFHSGTKYEKPYLMAADLAELHILGG